MRALDIIRDAYERLNRLSPGETLGAEETAFAFRRLNLLVDEMSAVGQFLFRTVLTSAAQTGNITLGAGSWASIPVGTKIHSASQDGFSLAPLDMAQYGDIYAPTTTGTPAMWAHDGLATVYLYPVATGQTIELETRVGVSEFADTTTTYTAPQGYESLLGASLAVRLASPVLGRLPPELVREERRLSTAVRKYRPAIVDVQSFTGGDCSRSSILYG
jgi:hypothetical protein